MLHRFRGTFAFHLLLALTAVVQTTDREWLCAREDEASPIVGAVGRESGRAAPALAANNRLDGPPHGPCCPCCQLSNQRMSLVPPPAHGDLQPAISAPSTRVAGSLLRQHHASPTSRGPPAR